MGVLLNVVGGILDILNGFAQILTGALHVVDGGRLGVHLLNHFLHTGAVPDPRHGIIELHNKNIIVRKQRIDLCLLFTHGG